MTLPAATGAECWVVGDIMLDVYCRGRIERQSPAAPVPVVRMESAEYRLGGAANVAHNLAALGARVRLFGAYGRDHNARTLCHALEAAGIENHAVVVEDRPTTTKTRILDRGRPLLRLDQESVTPIADSARAKLHRNMSRLPVPDAVIVSDYAKGVAQPETLRSLQALAPRPLLLVDPKASSLARFRGFDYATPNHEEARQAAGCAAEDLFEPAPLAGLLAQFGGPLLITRGAQGMALVRAGPSVVLQAPTARAVVDVTGAGDSAIAAFALGLAAGQTAIDAMRMANLCAGLAVERDGTYAVSHAELAARWPRYAPPSEASS